MQQSAQHKMNLRNLEAISNLTTDLNEDRQVDSIDLNYLDN